MRGPCGRARARRGAGPGLGPQGGPRAGARRAPSGWKWRRGPGAVNGGGASSAPPGAEEGEAGPDEAAAAEPSSSPRPASEAVEEYYLYKDQGTDTVDEESPVLDMEAGWEALESKISATDSIEEGGTRGLGAAGRAGLEVGVGAVAKGLGAVLDLANELDSKVQSREEFRQALGSAANDLKGGNLPGGISSREELGNALRGEGKGVREGSGGETAESPPEEGGSGASPEEMEDVRRFDAVFRPWATQSAEGKGEASPKADAEVSSEGDTEATPEAGTEASPESGAETSPESEEVKPDGVEGLSKGNLMALDRKLKALGLVRKRELGRGKTAVVFLANKDRKRKSRETWNRREPDWACLMGGKVVVKAILDEARRRQVARRDFRREMVIWEQMDHPNIVELLHYDTKNLFLVTEYCAHGNLYDPLKSTDGLPALDVKGIALDLASALEHIHSRGVVHRDVKSLNVLLDYGPSGLPRAKLCDFGTADTARKSMPWAVTPEDVAAREAAEAAKAAEAAEDKGLLGNLLSTVTSSLSTDEQPREAVGEGTPFWMAPEALQPKEVLLSQSNINLLAPRMDVYSFGVVLWELLHRGKIPWFSDFEVTEREDLVQAVVVDRKKLPIDDSINAQVRDLIGPCWRDQLEDRPSMQQLVQRLKMLRSAPWDSDGSLKLEELRSSARLELGVQPKTVHISLAWAQPFSIGRLGTSSLCLPLKGVSRKHAEIFCKEEEPFYYIRDMRSTNGTMVDGRFLDRGEECILVDGNEIVIGKTTMVYRNKG